MRRAAGWLGLVTLLGVVSPARAERDLDEPQGSTWAAIHVGILSAGVVGTGILQFAVGTKGEARFEGAWGFERFGQRNFSMTTSRITDATLATALVTPVAAFGSNGSAERFDNQLLIYGETLSLSLVLNTFVKRLVLRARPYMFNPDAGARRYARDRSVDNVLSFYSGHAAMSFSGAVAGAYLFSDSAADEPSQAALWALELSLASFTAHGRVRAGMHYATDVIVGSLLGTAFGLGVPLAQGVYAEITPAEWAALGGGLILGTSLGFLLPTKTAQDLAAYDFRVNPVGGGATVSVGSVW